MMKYIIILGILLQLACPLQMIISCEITKRTGQELVLRCAPIDPMDPFRGRYVALRFDSSVAESRQPKENESFRNELHYGDTCWAQFVNTQTNGYKLMRLAPKPSAEGVWIKTHNARMFRERYLPEEFKNSNETWKHYKDRDYKTIHIKLDQNRFYLNEKQAPRAETAYNRREWKEVYAVLRVRNGNPVLVDLLCDGKPIADAMKTLPTEPKKD